MELDLSTSAIAALKSEAKTVRQDRTWDGTPTSHSEALELVAQHHGARDWNTLRAQAAKPVRLEPGMRVAGRYLGQPFTGHVRGLEQLSGDAQMRVTLHFDTPVDVVTFDSFSAYRQRVTAVIGADGCTLRRTSDGMPHLVIELAGL